MSGRKGPLLYAADALSGLRDPFGAMTSLVFLLALTSDEHSRAQPPESLWWTRLGPEPTGRQINAALAELEAGCPDHLEGALVHPGFDTIGQAALERAVGYVQKFLTHASTIGERDLFGMAFMQGQSLSQQQRMGAFYTPGCVGSMMATMSGPSPAEWVCEPACGTGSLILQMIDEAITEYGPVIAESITYIGIELDPVAARLTRMNMVLAGAAANSHIFCGNSLSRDIVAANPAANGALCVARFHLVVANPPFGTSVRMSDLEPDEPFVIPDRLLNRPVAVPSGYELPADDPAQPDAPAPEPRVLPRVGEQLGFELQDDIADAA